MAKKKFKIEGMHCSSCAVNIDFDLEDLEGVKFCRTSYARSESEIEFDESIVDGDAIIKTIFKTGYRATLKD